MDRHELDRMFDGLAPDPRRERELLGQLLQDDMRRKKPMKNWKRAAIGAAAAALLVTGAAAAVVVPRLNQGFLDYLNVESEDTEAVTQAENLLLPGAMELDITKESNGATLHMTQILRDRYTVMLLADFTAPEGTQLYMGEPDPDGWTTYKGFHDGSGYSVGFLDAEGARMGDGLVSSYGWEVLEDDDPMDNHLALMFTLSPQMGEDEAVWSAASLRVPAVDLAYYDLEQRGMVTVYSGDWSFETPLPQKDIGWAVQLNQAVGELDGAAVTAEELYLSPMTIAFDLSREGGLDFVGAALDEEGEAAYGRWMSIGNNVQRLTLTTGDGETIPLELTSGGGGIGENEKIVVHRLSQVTDPAKFLGGTLTLEWDFHNSEESGSVTLSLDNLAPVAPALSAD